MRKIAMLLAAALSAFGAWAWSGTETIDGITWNYDVNGNGAMIYKSSLAAAIPTSTTGAITIPPTLRGYPVTRIGNFAFSGCSGLTSVTIPNSVTSIGSGAFSGCSGLTSMTIPDSVTSIEVIAFKNCSSLTSVTIPDSVTIIGSSAFYGCRGLTCVTIGNGVTNIDDYAFGSCSGLMSFVVCSGNANYKSENGLLLSKDGRMLIAGVNGEVEIPDSVTRIVSYAFDDRINLMSVIIPNSVTNIGDCAFSGCTGIRQVVVPEYVCNHKMSSIFPQSYQSITNAVISKYVARIGHYTFSGCSELTSVTIPNSVTSIGFGTFHDCSSLASVMIPDSVTSIGDYAFNGCSGLMSFTVAADNPSYKSVSGLLLKKDGQTLVAGVNGNVSIPDGVTSIGGYAFSGCSGLTSVTIPDGVTSIGGYAFSGCSGLTSVTIPDSVERIGASVFSGCSGLEEITLPFVGNRRGNTRSDDSLFGYIFGNTSYICGTRITQQYSSGSLCSVDCYIPSRLRRVVVTAETVLGYGAFYNCSGLASVTIPDSVENIESSAFSGCSGLLSITVSSGNAIYKSSNGLLLSKDGTTLIQGVNGDVTIPDSVENIEFSAFSGCSGLTSVMIPNSVTNIGDAAFSGCSGLTSVTIPDGVTSIGDYAFSGCSGLTSVTIPDGVTSIGDYAFSGCSGLTSVTIPNSVTNIASYAFNACTGLMSVTVPQYVCDNAFSRVFWYISQSITNIVISDGVTCIGSSEFYSCTNLTSVTMPNSVTNIGSLAFNDCIGFVMYISPGDFSRVYKLVVDSGFQGNMTIVEGKSDFAPYCVVDLSAGANAEQYPVEYLYEPPEGGFNADEYKTTKLVLRLVHPGVFTMGCSINEIGYRGWEAVPHRVLISEPFYIGMFEVTQKQYELVMGSNPSSYEGEKRPVESVSWNAIRGSSTTFDWPNSAAVDPLSFMGKLRTKTGIATFDLPTEAKWEYACRAGTTTALNNGMNLTNGGSGQDSIMDKVGRYVYYALFHGQDNGAWTDGFHTEVGTYPPNRFGLYDMHGNVWEWTLDWYRGREMFSTAVMMDPVGPASGSSRVLRGGSGNDYARDCRSSNRGNFGNPDGGNDVIGFRLCFSTERVSGVEGYSVALDKRGGSGGISDVTVVCGGAMPSITVPTREGYAFDGYWSNEDGSGTQYYAASGAGVHTWNKTSAATLYAKWTAVYEVVLDGQGGGGGEQCINVAYGEDMPSITVPVRQGYVFGGYWSGQNGLGTQYYHSTGESAHAWDKSSTATLYANWTQVDGHEYIVIDLWNNGQLSYLDDIPPGGWKDEYKTSKLVLRRIAPGTFTTGCEKSAVGFTGYDYVPHEVMISKPFYMGIFEVTQKQYESVMGTNPSRFKGDARPVEQVSWNAIRGASSTYDWPNSKDVDPSSFMGRLRAKTQISTFDLPTQAMWEYACRAGTTTSLNSGKNLSNGVKDSNMDEVGRYKYNCHDGRGGDFNDEYDDVHTTVGSYLPNAWGLCDMHGNVFEWCLDYCQYRSMTTTTKRAVDPVGNATGSTRTVCGGSSMCFARWCTSSSRDGFESSFVGDATGFRIVCAPPEPEWTIDSAGVLTGAELNGFRDIVIPNSVTTIGKSVFAGNYRLTSVTIPDSVKNIGDYAFSNCGGLTNLTIPDSVKNIGEYAFSNCGGLTNLTIGNGVTSIGEAAFWLCSGLTSVTIPASVTNIVGSAFSYCEGLESFAVDHENANYKDVLGLLLSKDGRTLVAVPGSLTSVVIPGDVTSIGSSAFLGCSGLTSVTIPDSVTSIGGGAFYGCSGLTSVTIPDSVKSVGMYAFSDCWLLDAVYITDVAKWCEISFDGRDSNPLRYAKRLFLNGSLLEELSIPDGVTSIGEKAFVGCSGLTSVAIPNSVTSIGSSAFSGCSGLTSVTIPNSMTNIGYYAFSDCSGLTSIYVSIGDANRVKALLTKASFYNSNVSFIEIDMSSFPKIESDAELAEALSGSSDGRLDKNIKSMAAYNAFRGWVVVNLIDQKAAKESPRTWFSYAMGADELVEKAFQNEDVTIEAPTVASDGAISFVVDVDGVTIGSSATVQNLATVFEVQGSSSLADDSFSSANVDVALGVSDDGKLLVRASPKAVHDSFFVRVRMYAEAEDEQGAVAPVSTLVTVTFDANGGVGGTSRLVAVGEPVGTLPSVSRENYAFDNWWTAAIGGSQVGASTVVTGDVTYYAHWAATYEVTYKPGVNGSGAQQTVTKTQDVPLALKDALFTRDGYTQAGWATSDGGAKAYDLGASYTANAAVTLYPFWTANIYAVTYKPGTDGNGSQQVATKTHDVALVLKDALFTRDGYTQTGWATSDGGAKAYDLGAAYTANVAVTLYPFWTAHTYTVTYNPGADGSGSQQVATKTHDVALALVGALFTRKGYVQTGWATSDGGAKAYDLGASYTANAPVTLYPVWEVGFNPEWTINSKGVLTRVDLNGATDIVIPDSVTSIGFMAFYGCSGLTSVTIPNSVTNIGNMAFLDCGGLTSLTIPDSVISIGASAFSGCSGLTSVTIGNGVKRIGASAFNHCGGLLSISVGSANEMYAFVNGLLLSKDGTALIRSINANVVIPDSVTSIGSGSFSGCSGLTSVTIPDSVKNIGGMAFYGCSGLTSVTIPNSVTNIEVMAFYGCSGLTSVIMIGDAPSVDSGAFYGVSSSCRVHLPQGNTTYAITDGKWQGMTVE